MLSTIATSALGFAAKDLAAGAKRANVKAQASSEFAYGLPGNIAPAGDFDPAGFLQGKSELEVMRLREAEITHGRVGMLAAAGFLVQENFHPLFNGLGGPAIEQIPQLPAWLWFVGTLGVGICEANRIQIGWANPYENPANVQALKPGYTPGDLNFDPLGLKPTTEAGLLEMQTKELQNGRLAMLGITSVLIANTVPGSIPLPITFPDSAAFVLPF